MVERRERQPLLSEPPVFEQTKPPDFPTDESSGRVNDGKITPPSVTPATEIPPVAQVSPEAEPKTNVPKEPSGFGEIPPPNDILAIQGQIERVIMSENRPDE